jgi:hypothetical protein
MAAWRHREPGSICEQAPSPGAGRTAAISGFMVVKNVVAQGYPFLEAIRAAIPACDEFLVSDGYSTDGTWEALQVLQLAHPEKVRLFRDAWRGDTRRGAIIADMTNILKPRCRFEYCFNLQANEVIHEATCEQIRDLPGLYPHCEMFRLPFLNLMGPDLAWHVDFRRRIFRNQKHIVSQADGYDCGYTRKMLWTHPRAFLQYLLHRAGERPAYLTRPIFRYRAIFPANYLVKLATRTRLFTRSTGTVAELEYARAVADGFGTAGADPRDFWANMQPFFDAAVGHENRSGLRRAWWQLPLRSTPFPDQGPEIVRPLFGGWRYDVGVSLRALGAPEAIIQSVRALSANDDRQH